MAREAGFSVDGDSWVHSPNAILVDGRKSIDKQLTRFAALVAAHEREECAKLAERTLCAALTGHYVDPIGVWGTQVAIDIRKRSNT